MVGIDVDFEIFKALTSRRQSEADTYSDVIRRLLPDSTPVPAARVANKKAATFKGVSFEDGTQFRANYKGRTFTAEIKDGVWVDADGTTRNSPSEAAVKITKKNWNGWRFWHCKRPGEATWRLIDELRPKMTTDDLLV